MAEYIKKSDAFEKCGWYNLYSGGSVCALSKKEIAEIPAADVVEVVHGEWIEEIIGSYIPAEWDENGNLIEHHYKRYRCSLCGRKEGKKEPYCNCGAKMNGERRAE